MPGKKEKGLMPVATYRALMKAAGWLEKVESARAQESDIETSSCDPGCPGWAVFETNRGLGQEIECCDLCKRFPSDEAATSYVMHKLGEEMMRRHESEIEREEKEEEALESPQPPDPEVRPLFISDNEVGITLVDTHLNKFHIGRYGVWAERNRKFDPVVVDTSDSLEELTQKWGRLPVYKIEVQPTSSPDAGKSEEMMKHLDREAGD